MDEWFYWAPYATEIWFFGCAVWVACSFCKCEMHSSYYRKHSTAWCTNLQTLIHAESFLFDAEKMLRKHIGCQCRTLLLKMFSASYYCTHSGCTLTGDAGGPSTAPLASLWPLLSGQWEIRVREVSFSAPLIWQSREQDLLSLWAPTGQLVGLGRGQGLICTYWGSAPSGEG